MKSGLSDPRQIPVSVVIWDAITNMIVLVILTGVVFVLSKLSWRFGVISFWILVAIVSITILQYVVTTLAYLVYLTKCAVTGFRGDWYPFRSNASLLVGTAFKIAESAIALYLVWRLWLHFYR